MSLVSIVVPSRGGASRLPHLLTALTAQHDSQWEAIVVLDGDIDGSNAAIADHADCRVRTITFSENQGRVAALNAGFEDARGDVLIRCDDDLRPHPGYVAAHRASHSGAPCGTVGLYQNVYPDTPYARVYGQAMDHIFRNEAYATAPARRWQYWAGNVSVTRDTWEKIGRYDPDYRAYGWEDVDYGYRLHVAGIPIVLDRNLETPHHVAATTTRIRATRAFLSGAAQDTFEKKHGREATGLTEHSQPGLWNRLVSVGGRCATPRTIAAAAAAIDRTLPILPRWVGHKAVAWTVESASLGGQLRPTLTRTDI
ncbi:MAG: glycosyltransferase family 2 protein [Propioniciclava sp.]